jgi:hypothetical protein
MYESSRKTSILKMSVRDGTLSRRAGVSSTHREEVGELPTVFSAIASSLRTRDPRHADVSYMLGIGLSFASCPTSPAAPESATEVRRNPEELRLARPKSGARPKSPSDSRSTAEVPERLPKCERRPRERDQSPRVPWRPAFSV